MAYSQRKSKRKSSSGLYNRKDRKKKIRELGNEPTHTKIAKPKIKSLRTRGGHIKQTILGIDTANVFDGKTYVKASIKGILENAANRNYVRRGILTKGAIIDTDKGRAKITSRPGQEGCINAVLVKEKTKA
mgnify:CR=1 FL=1|tara:strand:- start:498 stop:890 length:393 start_codon:yes stop_codon:yes gene_type:complete